MISNVLTRIAVDEEAQGLVEYAFILSLVSVAAVLLVGNIGSIAASWFVSFNAELPG
ncbi:hypothetical protein MM300_04095 [Evansella sp. LMS18]|uniref:Flp family type IVb pilin n=1 Tax=Evansella sp. LMS18 TaxID=2924033 RepID=UPI0020D17C0F|nr:hypothetical protein [Evansella sp. LMS18]UTR11521.1 hypothetical protein MM300_04095 [Evansella sp. LMS18]